MIEEHWPLLENLVYMNRAQTILEIGVAEAVATDYLCRGAAAVGPSSRVYGYDGWAVHGLSNQFQPWATKESCELYLQGKGHSNFELTQLNSTSEEFKQLIKTKHPVIDLAFIDGCHSYIGVKNDFDIIYPQLNSITGIIVFHDTLRIDGTREFIIDLRTKFWDGTYDIVDFPYGNCGGWNRRVGISVLVKRAFAQANLPLDEQCNLENNFNQIYEKERTWYNKELSEAKTRYV